MDRLSRFVVLIVLSVLGKNLCLGETSLNPFPLGTIGCLVSDVCDSGQICTNDLLFGSCQSIFSRVLNGENKFRLRTQQIERLEDEIERLIKAGFTWKDAFTQCTLQNTLLEFSKERIFDRFLCEDALGVSSEDWPDGVNNEIAAVLLELLKSGELDLFDQTNAERAEAGLDILNSNKRDEIVQVHKYFDKSKGQLKRDPYFEDTGSSYKFLYPNESPDPYSLYYSKNLMPIEDDYSRYQYLDARDEGTSSPESNLETEEGLAQDDDAIPYLNDIAQPALDARGLETAMGVQEPNHTGTEEELPLDPTTETLSLSSEDERTLEGLLEGTILPDSLGKEQQARLQVFIQGLIRVLEDNEGDLTSSQQPDNDVPESFMFVDQDTNDATGPNDMDERPLEEVIPPEDLASTGEDLNVMRAKLFNSDILMDKKTPGKDEEDAELADSMGPEAPSDSPRAVDSHSMYLQLSKEVSIPSGMQFVQNLTDILKLPPGLIGFIQVGPGRMINLEVNTDPEGKWNAERIANEAQLVNDDLVKATGISVEGAGVGRDGNRLEVKPNESYEVLTFVLVGTIAGVVLAVVTIYLIKRHHRSKQKLAQLASNGEGNEASKDYQDLCRQRMQGKSSEKPEPLHAASRIGSVSETQVRSPSSRSSTSSWSEEPAATNMDISTGHIVLSYMEDHLKNQDRLDREWEAVSSYMADPSSTKIANDPSNMRKNRFADTLPYDHSRVILSSNANVANSDYINASFITDHDPRNPAYICTQGPLPHTVADFWQMIWEQGSVVIVMLTKLGENGTGLCHRYWPEEGSDLYHIYEVHLVSEHIWCDDYLVRSFYLKNLQTNETRTVTQFHFLTWPQLSVPASIKALLDFRRKVNKSFRGRSCPIVVHCSEGCGRSGTYCLIDMVLNKMAKGAKEIDMAATLEHIRDQRMSMVKTKEQFQFSLAAVAEEVHAILKALPQ